MTQLDMGPCETIMVEDDMISHSKPRANNGGAAGRKGRQRKKVCLIREALLTLALLSTSCQLFRGSLRWCSLYSTALAAVT